MRSLLTLLLLIFVNSVYSQNYDNGEKIFSLNCVACHKMDEALVGPKLNTVVKLQGEDWVKSWIKNNVELRESGDKHAKEVYEKYRGSAMPVYEGMLSEEELDDLVFYLENWDSKQKELEAQKPQETSGQVIDGGVIEVKIQKSIQIIIFLCFAIMVMGFLFMYRSFKLMSKLYFKGRILQTYLLRKVGMEVDEAETELNDYIEEKVEEKITIRKSQLKKLLNKKIDDLEIDKEEEDWFSKIYDRD